MGNISSVKETEGDGAQDSSGCERERMSFQECLGEQSPPRSPRGAINSPLLFTSQVPMAPFHWREEANCLNHGPKRNDSEYETVLPKQYIPAMITWSHGGEEVSVQGSWDNWRIRQPLERSGKDFNIVKVLPSGVYQYSFIVDGEWTYSPDLPWIHDELGNACNVLDLQEFVPDDIETVAGFEPPVSPESSYNNWPIGSEDFAKEPPAIPSQLHVTLLNTPSPAENSSSLAKPKHVILNHLYIQKSKNGQPVVALGMTHRFLSKFVTVVLCKSLQR